MEPVSATLFMNNKPIYHIGPYKYDKLSENSRRKAGSVFLQGLIKKRSDIVFKIHVSYGSSKPMYSDKCPICMEEGCDEYIFSCLHPLHRACLSDEIESCPQCRMTEKYCFGGEYFPLDTIKGSFISKSVSLLECETMILNHCKDTNTVWEYLRGTSPD